jgi:hypothetical protein
MRGVLSVIALWGLGLLQPVLTTAQVAPIEFGVDATFDMSLFNGTTSYLSLPGRGLRVGVLVSDVISVENRISFRRLEAAGNDAATNLSLQLSGVFHFTHDRTQPQGYVNPTVGLLSSFFGNTSGAQLLWGCGVGVKIPMTNFLSARFEAGYWYGSENEDFQKDDFVTVKAGLSLFTK